MEAPFVKIVPNQEMPSWEYRVDDAIVDQPVTRFLIVHIELLMQQVKADIAMYGGGEITEDQALALAKLYAYRRQIKDKLGEGAIEAYRDCRDDGAPLVRADLEG